MPAVQESRFEAYRERRGRCTRAAYMSRVRLASFAALLLLPPSALLAQTGEGWSEEQRPIADLIQRTAAANNTGDVEAWVSLFADDAVYMPPGAPAVTTKQGLVEIARAGFLNRADIEIEPIEIVVTGPWAFARTRVRGTVDLHTSGDTMAIDMKQIAIYRRTDSGEWRIARLINNSNS